MKILINTLLIVILFLFSNCSSSKDTLVVSFYNLENLFDTNDDIEKDSTYIGDNEFTPNSKKEWNDEKLDKKMSNISKIIRLMKKGSGPDILGFCESENKAVAQSMFDKFLNDLNYELVYYESDDSRGIDVGLAYKKDIFNLLDSKPLKIDSVKNTRDILFTNLKYEEDTISVFVNHWPSRRGGEKESENLRIYAAQTLKNECNKLLLRNKQAKIIIIGDFNDFPDNNSILNTLNAKPFLDCGLNSYPDFNNLSYKLFSEKKGSYYYQNSWNMLDQIIVSSGLLSNNGLRYKCHSFEIIQNELNKTRSGKFKDAPFPTYAGDRYLGGYSDHFPVSIELEK